MAKVIIGLVGQMASGKDVTKKYLEARYLAGSCRFSTILRDVLDRISVPQTRENVQKISTVLRDAFGQDLLAKVIANDSIKHDAEVVAIDGVRRDADIVHLRSLPNFFLIAVDAKPEIRHARMVKRNENVGDGDKTFEQFMQDHKAETEVQIPGVMAEADFTIDNNPDGFDSLYQSVDRIMTEIQVRLGQQNSR